MRDKHATLFEDLRVSVHLSALSYTSETGVPMFRALTLSKGKSLFIISLFANIFVYSFAKTSHVTITSVEKLNILLDEITLTLTISLLKL